MGYRVEGVAADAIQVYARVDGVERTPHKHAPRSRRSPVIQNGVEKLRRHVAREDPSLRILIHRRETISPAVRAPYPLPFQSSSTFAFFPNCSFNDAKTFWGFKLLARASPCPYTIVEVFFANFERPVVA